MYLRIKRILDVIFSLLLILILIPVGLIIAVLIKTTSKGPVIFKQNRLGYKGKAFQIYKFRTMVQGAEKMGTGVYSYQGDPRVTVVGKILRKTSLDELPQLINILKGEMSFIGPRPTLTYHPYKVEDYSNEQRKRFEVKPGVTGFAQISGRKELPWEERIKLDVIYVNNVSFLFDLKIFFQTVLKVVLMKDNHNVNKTGEDHDRAS